MLFPPRCAGCGQGVREDAVFCDECSASVVRVASPVCRVCGLPLGCFGPSEVQEETCARCLREPPRFDRARAVYQYSGAMARAIRKFKFKRCVELGKRLALLLAPALADMAEEDPVVVVPVPLHPRRLREREFNQALVLAQAACRVCNRWGKSRVLRPDPWALRRVRDTVPQSNCTAAERRENVVHAFAACKERVAGREVLLIDDVLTTGATAGACAAALLDAGARRVEVLTLARALP